MTELTKEQIEEIYNKLELKACDKCGDLMKDPFSLCPVCEQEELINETASVTQ